MNTVTRLIAIVIIIAAAVGIPHLLKQGDDSGKEVGFTQSGEETIVAIHKPPRFVDLGTTSCAPCRVMLGVMEVLEQRYPEALQVDFINVQLDADSVKFYGIRAIPTQIFYSPDGQELFRHIGVMRADEIVAKWKTLGYDLDAPAEET